MNDVLQALLSRRSVRRYRDTPLTRQQIDTVLEAGRYAASGMNRQPVRFAAVTQPALISRLSSMNAAVMGRDTDPFYGAPCVIVVLADPAASTWLQDGSLAMGNMMLAAHSLGLGSCWINRAKEMFAADEGKALLGEWGLPDTLCGVACLVVGYPDGPLPEAAPRKEHTVVYLP